MPGRSITIVNGVFRHEVVNKDKQYMYIIYLNFPLLYQENKLLLANIKFHLFIFQFVIMHALLNIQRYQESISCNGKAQITQLLFG